MSTTLLQQSTGGSINSSPLLACAIIVVTTLYWHYYRWSRRHQVALKGSVNLVRPQRSLINGHAKYFSSSSLHDDILSLQREHGPLIVLTTPSFKDCFSLDQIAISLWTLITLNLSTLFPLSERLQAIQNELYNAQSNNIVRKENEEALKSQIAKGSTRVYVIAEDSLVREIMSKRPNGFKRYVVGANSGHLSRGLYHAEDSKWLAIRRITAMSFSRQFVQKHSGLCWQLTEQWTEDIKNQIEKENKIERDIYSIVFLFSLHLMLKVIIGNENEDSSTTTGWDYLLRSDSFINDAQQIISTSYNSDLSGLSRFGHFRGDHDSSGKANSKVVIDAHKRIDAALSQILVDRLRNQSTNRSPSTNSMVDVWISRLNDLSWVTSLKSESERENEKVLVLVENVKSILISGVATSSHTISWAILMMSIHPNVLQRIRGEGNDFITGIRNSNGLPGIDTLNQFPYMEGFLNELLRLKSPSNILAFETATKSESVNLAYGLVIQPQDVVLVHLNSFMRNPDVFVDPDSFEPTRWLTSDIAKKEEMTANLLAFGLGTRVCPGMTLGKIHVYYAVVLFADRFNFNITDEGNPKTVNRPVQICIRNQE